MSLMDWLGIGPARKRDPEAEVVHRISQQLDTMDPAEARHLSLFAFLLARVAYADLVVHPSEVEAMERIVTTHGKLSSSQAALVVEIARATQKMLGPTHNFVAIREFRDAATTEQKLGLLHCLFEISASDDVVTGAEEEEIRTISRGLLLDDRDYLAVRSAFNEKRSVMRSRPPT
jgi:uncharacterized tellurite resistance protein B-like protein